MWLARRPEPDNVRDCCGQGLLRHACIGDCSFVEFLLSYSSLCYIYPGSAENMRTVENICAVGWGGKEAAVTDGLSSTGVEAPRHRRGGPARQTMCHREPSWPTGLSTAKWTGSRIRPHLSRCRSRTNADQSRVKKPDPFTVGMVIEPHDRANSRTSANSRSLCSSGKKLLFNSPIHELLGWPDDEHVIVSKSEFTGTIENLIYVFPEPHGAAQNLIFKTQIYV